MAVADRRRGVRGHRVCCLDADRPAMTQWTISTLKELFERTIEDRDVRVNLALSAAKEAVSKAEAADEKRFSLLNEFRGQQADLATKYAAREYVDQAISALSDRVKVAELA